MNPEIKQYFNILCNNDYPKFIDKYISTKPLQRLDKIGQFCGCDYTKIFNCKYWYSRLSHSIACSLMAWHFTKDKTQTLAALFHDLGTPAFSHTIDYLLGDAMNQNSSEKSVKDIINESDEIISLLKEDNISLDDVTDLDKYPILENERPKLCVDRLDGILHTGLIWIGFWNLEDIKKIYTNITVLKNEEGVDELGFEDLNSAEYFYRGQQQYSLVLQQNEDKYTMQFISDILKILINEEQLTIQELYVLSEAEIIKKINACSKTSKQWDIFCKTSKIKRSKSKPKNCYYISTACKKRYVIPLVGPNRIDEVSLMAKELLKEYNEYSDTLYAYIDGIEMDVK